jgi:hypothetical protein
MVFDEDLYVCWSNCSLGYVVISVQKQLLVETPRQHFLLQLSFVGGIYAASVDNQISSLQTIEHTTIDQYAVGGSDLCYHNCFLGLSHGHTYQIVKMMPPLVCVKHYC